MKCHLVFLLTLGLVIADPILKQTISADNNHAPSEYSESEIKQNANFNKGDTEQKNEEINATLESIIGSEMERDQNVEVIIEEAIDLPNDLVPPPPETEDVILNDNGLSLADDLYPNEMIEKHPEEIMDTAFGFAPLPFIRRRQKPRRRFATRRHHYQRNPYRRVFYYYPYYPHYYQSSLRYY